MDKINEWNKSDFANNHPYITYFMVTGVAASICKGVVGIARALTGKYPPAPTFNYNKPETNEVEEKNELKEEDIESDVLN